MIEGRSSTGSTSPTVPTVPTDSTGATGATGSTGAKGATGSHPNVFPLLAKWAALVLKKKAIGFVGSQITVSVPRGALQVFFARKVFPLLTLASISSPIRNMLLQMFAENRGKIRQGLVVLRKICVMWSLKHFLRKCRIKPLNVNVIVCIVDCFSRGKQLTSIDFLDRFMEKVAIPMFLQVGAGSNRGVLTG